MLCALYISYIIKYEGVSNENLKSDYKKINKYLRYSFDSPSYIHDSIVGFVYNVYNMVFTSFFDVLLTVPLSIILVTDQLNAQIIVL